MILNIIIFFLFFYLLLSSTIGLGFFFQKLCFSHNKIESEQTIVFTGFYGLFFLTIISLITSLFVPHNFIHNTLIHFFGLLCLLTIKANNKKKYLKEIFYISLFTISAVLISKTHDDFSYYHLPFTKYLTEHKVIFGMGYISHGFNLISSLFFLNSTFYLPLINYFSFHFSLIFFLIFFNFYLFREILSKSNHEIVKYLYLISFIFFTLSFNRLAEYGTDKAGQLLIVILTIKFLQLVCFSKNQNNFQNILLIMPLLAFCITLKTYFLPYILLSLLIFFLKEKLINTLKFLCISRSFIFFLLILFFYYLQNFISTGCLISPLSTTCFGDNLDWARGREHYSNLSTWLEQWAKSGAGPDFRVDNPKEYIQNFNWLPRWFDNYFKGKVSDQFLLLIFTYALVFIAFKRLKLSSKNLNQNIKIILFYFILLIIFFIWFTNHPQLRYGGYAISFLSLSIPVAFLFQKFIDKPFFEKNLKYVIILIIIVFNSKNLFRINNEFARNDLYKFDNFPFYALPKIKFLSEKTNSGLEIFKTNGHCWDLQSPCVRGLNKFPLKIVKKKGYYFLIDIDN